MIFFCLVVNLAFNCLTTVVSCSRTNFKVPEEQKIIRGLLEDYDTAARPVFNASKAVLVKFGLAFIQICDMVNEKIKQDTNSGVIQRTLRKYYLGREKSNFN